MQWIWNQLQKWNIKTSLFTFSSRFNAWNQSVNLVVALVDCIISIPHWTYTHVSSIAKSTQIIFPFQKKKKIIQKWRKFGFWQSLPYYTHCVSVAVAFFLLHLYAMFLYIIEWVEGNGLLIHPLTPNKESFTFRSIDRLHHSNGKNAFMVTFSICLSFVCLFIAVICFAWWCVLRMNLFYAYHSFLLLVLHSIHTEKNWRSHMNHGGCHSFYNFFRFT